MVFKVKYKKGMIIDHHVHVYDVPEPAWRNPPSSAEALIELMDGPYTVAGEPRRVDISLIQPTPGVTILRDWDFRKQHECVVEAVRKYPDRLIGVMMINPHYGLEDAFLELERLVKEEGFGMIKMHPAFHNYWPNKCKHLSYPIMEAARKFNLPVLIHTGEPPFAVPALTAPLAEAFPDVNIILAHFGTQKICYSDDAIEVARKHDNVFLGTDWGHLNRIKEGVETLGASKLVFGTDTPFTEIGVGLRTIEACCFKPVVGMNMSKVDRDKIYGGNMAELLGLK